MPPNASPTTTVATARPGPDAAARVGAAWRSPWLPVISVALVLVGSWLWTGTAPGDIVRYAGYAAWAVVLPGTLVYRALRRTPYSLVDDLAMGAVVGLTLEIPAYVLGSLTDQRHLLVAWPLAVVVPFAAVPRLRRHWRRHDSYRAVPSLAWAWTVAGVAAFLVSYLTFAYLRVNQPVPTNRPQEYFIDQQFFLALVGEAKHRFPLQVPGVAGEPLAYHWFAFADMATASLISGVDAPVVVFRLALPLLSVLAVALLAVVGWRVTGRAWVGAVATALTFAVGELAVGTLTPASIGGITAFLAWGNLSLVYGHLFTFALIAVVADRLVGTDYGYGRAGWVLLGLFALAAPGAKATITPVLLGGLALVCLVQLVRRLQVMRQHQVMRHRLSPRPWLIAAILVAGQAFGALVFFRFQSLGLNLRPLSILDRYGPTGPDTWWASLGAASFVLTGYVIFMFSRLAGIPVLAWLHRRDPDRVPWGPLEWFLLGGVGSGMAATLLLWQSGFAQNYFLRSGWALGAILSAMGLVALVQRHRVPNRSLSLIAAGVAIAVPLVSAPLWRLGAGRGGPGWRGLLPVFWLALAVAAVAALTALALRRRPGLAGVAVLSLVLGAGWLGLPWDARLKPNAGHSYHVLVSPPAAAAARLVRERSDPHDMIATNGHCLKPPPAACTSLSYWLAGFAERRVLLESWGYSPEANQQPGHPGEAPFGDPARLARNDAAFTAPTAPLMQWLWDSGVRWLVVDRGFGHEAADLVSFATPVFDQDGIAVYRLDEP